MAVPGGCSSPHLLLFLFILSSSRIFLLLVSRIAPEPLACYCCSSCSPVPSPSQLSQGDVHCSCISHVAPHSSISCTHYCCSYSRILLLSLFLAALISSLACQISSSISPTLTFLLSAALFLLSTQFVISCCIWLVSFSLPLSHSKPHTSSASLVTIYAIQSSLLRSPSSHPFWCASPG